MPYPETDILIVTHNARYKLARCLRSVIRFTPGMSYQITVLDNASTDGTSEYLQKNFSKRIQLIKSLKNLGFSGGINLLLRKTKKPWVVLLDDDAEVTQGWFERFYAIARRKSNVGIISGKVVYPNQRIFCAEFSIVPFGSVGRSEFDRGQRNYSKEVDAVPGPCWLMPRAVIKRVGPFDERFFPCQYEDIDYCLRVRVAGYKIYYDGSVPIVHHNLYRKGSGLTLNKNITIFFKKWQKALSRFPLCALSKDDLLIHQGAKILREEVFCPEHPVFGKWVGLNSRFCESLYRGIAYIKAGKYQKAVSELRETKRANRNPSARFAYEMTSLYYILSIYFLKLGLKKEAEDCARRVMSRILPSRQSLSKRPVLDERHQKKLCLDLHGWSIRVLYNDPRYLETLKRSFPHYKHQLTSQPKRVVDGNLLEIFFFNKTHKKNAFSVKRKQGLITSHCPEFGLYRVLDQKRNQVSVFMNQRQFIKGNWLLHGAFLGPLAMLLQLQKATLVHGALLEKNKKGLLILGEKGAGKSTLSTACLDQGFRYFSDEHPILESKKGRVRGRSFVNDIALPAVSVEQNFKHLRVRMKWSQSRQKYLLDPKKMGSKTIGDVTDISLVVFPKFKANSRLLVKKLEPKVFLKRLLKDEYLKMMLGKTRKNFEKTTPRRIASMLAKKSSGYLMRYGAGDIARLPAVLERL